MIERLIQSQLPTFARLIHPVMRYTLLRELRRAGTTRTARILRRLLLFGFLTLLILFGYQVATGFGGHAVDQTVSALDRVYLVLYWPLVLIQIGIRLGAFAATTGTITTEQGRGTWESLKITTDGAGLALRTRWASVFYQLRYLLFLVVAARVFFLIVAVWNFSGFNGRTIDLMLTGTIPFGTPSPLGWPQLAVGVVIIAMQLSAAIVAPFTAVAFDAALGTLIGVVVRGRWLGILGQGMILFLRVAVSVISLWFGALALSYPVLFVGGYLAGSPALDSIGILGALRGWFGGFLGVAEGDLGLTLMHIPNAFKLFTDIDYGALIGVAMIGYVLLQAGAARLLLSLAVRRANRAERA